jgi:nitrite reductase/ring-hydroxylating ferredoxin subunit
MLSREDNELMTRVGPGTAMGDYLRRFWLPFALASELPTPDCPPARFTLLGEKLVGFRDSAGELGLVAENCPHRGASLFFGRNEEEGLRCVYHGWKFNTAGSCVDMPNEPPESNFKHKVKVVAYPCEERGGVLWAYLGPEGLGAQIPDLEWMHVPESSRYASRRVQRSNFMQSLEGELDSSHVGFLHSQPNPEVKPRPADLRNSIAGYMYRDKRPKLSSKETDAGLIIGARREAEEGFYYWRVTQYLLPTYTMIPPSLDECIHFTAAIPIDDETTNAFTVTWNPDGPLSEKVLAECKSFLGIHMEVDEKFNPVRNKDNDYCIDREQQRLGRTYTGIFGVREEDCAVQEGMGRIYDRTREHLGTADLAVIQGRRRLLRGARALRSGEEPYAATHGEAYRVRSASLVLPREMAWDEGTAEAQLARV